MSGTLQGGRLSGISLNNGTIGGITLSGGAIPRGGGLSRVQIMSLYYLFRAAAYTDPDVANLFANFKTAFGITDPVNITGISINATASVEETLTTPLTITLSPANADEQYSASWTSANTGIATVNGSGVVSGVSEGSTTITCSVTTFSGNTFTATCTVTVTEHVVAVTSITAVYTQSGAVYTTDSLDSLKSDLVVTAYYADSTSGVVASSAYTLSGTLTAGTSTITASYGGKTATFTVTVTADYRLHDWDFTQGLADSVGSVTAVLTHQQSADFVRDSNGLDFSTYGLCCDLGAVYDRDRTIDIYLSNVSLANVSYHARLLMFGTANNTSAGFLIYRNNTGWGSYISWQWSSTYTGMTDRHAFDTSGNVKITIKIDSNGTISLYKDDTLIGNSTQTAPTNNNTHLYIGSKSAESDGSNFYTAKVKRVVISSGV